MHAEDFAGLPATGITPVICGDAHLGNFGFYASPERELVFDLNDFDEAHPGAWEWDLRRLTTSVWVAGRQNGSPEDACGDAVARCVAEYRLQIAALAEQPLLARSYERLDVDRMRRTAHRTTRCARRSSASARTGPQAHQRPGAAPVHRAARRRRGGIVEEPPLITRPEPAEAEQLAAGARRLPGHAAAALGAASSAATASSTSRTRSSASAPWGCARGSRSARAAAPTTCCSCSSSRPAARWSRRFVHGDSAWHAHQGQRVVEYQQALQTVSDPLLGWTTVGDVQYYVRQFRDMKGAITVDGDRRRRRWPTTPASAATCSPRATPAPAAPP